VNCFIAGHSAVQCLTANTSSGRQGQSIRPGKHSHALHLHTNTHTYTCTVYVNTHLHTWTWKEAIQWMMVVLKNSTPQNHRRPRRGQVVTHLCLAMS